MEGIRKVLVLVLIAGAAIEQAPSVDPPAPILFLKTTGKEVLGGGSPTLTENGL